MYCGYLLLYSFVSKFYYSYHFYALSQHIIYLPGEMGPDFSPKMTVKSLTSQQLVRIHQLFRQAKFDDPSGNVCIPFHLYLFIKYSFATFICVTGHHDIEINQFYSVLVLQVNIIYAWVS
jgi:hypothetical protein